MTPRVHRAGPEDAQRLAELNRHVHDLHVEAEPDIYRPADVEGIARRLAAALEGPHHHAFLAFAGEGDTEDAVGHVVARFVDVPANAYHHRLRTVMVDELAVAPAGRRAGVGRALMDAVMALAREVGADRVELDVRVHNRDAREFYDALGFRPMSMRLGVDVKPRSNA